LAITLRDFPFFLTAQADSPGRDGNLWGGLLSRVALALTAILALVACMQHGGEGVTTPSEVGDRAGIAGASSAPKVVSEELSAEQAQWTIDERAQAVIEALRDRKIDRLTALAHPNRGVRFSPYAYVDVSQDVVLSRTELEAAWRDNKGFAWGYQDGSGEPIELTIQEYFEAFVYDVDFLNAEKIGYNTVLGMGNTINNAREVYENSIIVEYHFSGFNPAYEGMDWRSLRLVFGNQDGGWYLLAVIHDQWTI
jgi:hypothetical protein